MFDLPDRAVLRFEKATILGESLNNAMSIRAGRTVRYGGNWRIDFSHRIIREWLYKMYQRRARRGCAE